ncbi:Uncharacterised protein [Orientia tsutsugamushi]|nr:Uncharacterised protein [Orientia tsutsugamushi]
MPEIKLNLRPNHLRLFRYLSAIILHYLNQFRKKYIIFYTLYILAYYVPISYVSAISPNLIPILSPLLSLLLTYPKLVLEENYMRKWDYIMITKFDIIDL